MNTHQFTEKTTVTDLTRSVRQCGHKHSERCECERELWRDYERWISEREMEPA